MSYSLEYVKKFTSAIVKVSKVNNKLLFYESNNLIVPTRVILTHNLKSINIIDYPLDSDTDEARYCTEFYYHNDTKVASLDWKYAALRRNWKKETLDLINKTIELA